jgi:two-component system response regulator YesN
MKESNMEKDFVLLFPENFYSKLTVKTLHFIHTHVENPLRVGFVAQQLNVSAEHMIRIFKKDTGLTPRKYINKVKMEQAKSLLKESNLSVGKISISLGYKNRDHFCRLFHSMVEQSPRKYKSTHRLAEKQKSQCA